MAATVQTCRGEGGECILVVVVVVWKYLAISASGGRVSGRRVTVGDTKAPVHLVPHEVLLTCMGL